MSSTASVCALAWAMVVWSYEPGYIPRSWRRALDSKRLTHVRLVCDRELVLRRSSYVSASKDVGRVLGEDWNRS